MMSTWESVTLSQDEVASMKEPTFKKAWRGYDREEVTAHLKRLMSRIRVLEHNAAEFESELEQMRKAGGSKADGSASDESYEPLAQRLAIVLQAFDEVMQRLRTEAQAEADGFVEAAKADADRIRVDAQANAEAIRADAEREAQAARDQAHELLSGLESRRSSLLTEIRTLKGRMLEAARAMIPTPESDHPADEVTISDADLAVSERTGEPSGQDRQDLGTVLGDGDRVLEVRGE
jgi:cell division septum initiation protein DivIVA